MGGWAETGVCELASWSSDLRPGQEKRAAWQEGVELKTSRSERKRARKIQNGARSKAPVPLVSGGGLGCMLDSEE